MKLITGLILFSLLFNSCAFEIEKRRYMKGYHFSVSGLNKNSAIQPVQTKKIKTRNSFVRSTNNDFPEIILQPKNDSPIASIESSGINFQSRKLLKTGESNTIVSKDTKEIRISDSKVNLESGINKQKSDHNILMLSSFLMLGGLLMYAPLVSRSRKLGYWAIDNRKLVRGLHFVMNSLVAAGGLYTGINLAKLGIHTNPESFFAVAAFTAGVIVVYPLRKSRIGFFANSFKKQKWFSLLIALSGFLFAIQTGNILFSENRKEVIEQYNHKAFNTISALIDENISPEKRGLTDNDRVALTVLTIIFCVLLCILIAGLSCALFCAGQGAFAFLLLFGGITLAIVGTVLLAKKLMNPIRQKKLNEMKIP